MRSNPPLFIQFSSQANVPDVPAAIVVAHPAFSLCAAILFFIQFSYQANVPDVPAAIVVHPAFSLCAAIFLFLFNLVLRLMCLTSLQQSSSNLPSLSAQQSSSFYSI
jgi:hypothetical protein